MIAFSFDHVGDVLTPCLLRCWVLARAYWCVDEQARWLREAEGLCRGGERLLHDAKRWEAWS